jgi:hypothetical protein
VQKTIAAAMGQIAAGDDSPVTPFLFKAAQEEIKTLLAVDVLPYFHTKHGEEIKKYVSFFLFPSLPSFCSSYSLRLKNQLRLPYVFWRVWKRLYFSDTLPANVFSEKKVINIETMTQIYSNLKKKKGN